MIETLSKIGGRIINFLNESDADYEDISLRDLSQKASLYSGVPFADVLPYDAFDEETGLFIGVNSLGFAIEAAPIVGGDTASTKLIDSFFTELLDEEASIQCLLFADHRIEPMLSAWKAARGSSTEVLNKLAEKRAEMFKNSPGLSPRTFRFIFSYSVPFVTNDPQILEKVKEKKSKFLDSLKSLTLAMAWRPENLLEFVGGLVNFSPETKMNVRKWNQNQSLASQMTTGGKISIEEDKLVWKTDKETSFKSFRVVDFPNQWAFHEMQRLIGDFFRDSLRIQTPFFFHFGVYCPKQKTVEPGFWKRAYLVDNQGKSHTLLKWIPDLQKELKEYDYVRRSLNNGSRFVWTQFSVGIWGNKDKISQHEETLKSLFRVNQFTLVENHCIHLPQFLACLPMTWGEHVNDLKNLNVLRTTITDECVNFVPIQAEWQGTATPCMLLQGRRGQLLNWNPFDNKTGNYNVVVAGRSGTGKSVFMQDLLLNALSIGAKVFVLEVGRSFEKMAEIVDGQQIEFSKESNICLNPFTHILKGDNDARDTSISFLKSIIGCMAAPTKGTTDYENAVIENAVRDSWDKKGNQATITDIANWLKSNDDPRAKTIGTMLTPYTNQGVYAKHFEGINNVNFNKPMVLIELEELKDKKDLQAVVLQLFIMAITNQAFLGDRKTPFFICIDEAWDLLRGAQSGAFIETLARRLRKYNGSLVIGTQGIEDFFATPGSKAAYDNSDWMCLLGQKKSSLTALAESGKLDLSDAKRYALESVTTRQGQYSEIMICDAEGNYSVSRLILDKFSEQLYTTKAHEFVAIKELRKQGLSITEAIEKVLERKKRG